METSITNSPNSNPLYTIFMWCISAILFGMSQLTLDEVRAWIFWGLSVSWLLIQIYNHPAVKSFIKKLLK